MEPWEIHPALVHFPIALLLGAVAVDIYARARHSVGAGQVAAGLLIAGVLTGLVTGLAGLLAFYTVPSAHTEAAHDRVIWHLGLALASVVLFAGVAWLRWRGRRDLPSAGTLVAGLVAAVLLGVAGYLGGQIVYHGGMGIEPQILSGDLKHHHHEADHSHAETGDHHDH
jgi:uncharacterized membrane protein